MLLNDGPSGATAFTLPGAIRGSHRWSADTIDNPGCSAVLEPHWAAPRHSERAALTWLATRPARRAKTDVRHR
jgi:hypothetical protein